MGLMFILPVSEEEADRIEIKSGKITLKSYGLPMVFWGYLAASLIVVSAMALAVYGPLIRLYSTDDSINKAMVIVVAATLILLPFATICFYFYEKFIEKKEDELSIVHRVFWIPFSKKTFKLKSSESFEVLHHMDSPNVAKLKNDPTMKGFENKGYFQLFAKTNDDKMLFVDRSSRKADLNKIKALLSKY